LLEESLFESTQSLVELEERRLRLNPSRIERNDVVFQLVESLFEQTKGRVRFDETLQKQTACLVELESRRLRLKSSLFQSNHDGLGLDDVEDAPNGCVRRKTSGAGASNRGMRVLSASLFNRIQKSKFLRWPCRFRK
jgi:hypothetical protein